MTIEQYKAGLQARYKTLKLLVERDFLWHSDVDLMVDVRIKEMRLIQRIARLNGWKKEVEEA